MVEQPPHLAFAENRDRCMMSLREYGKDAAVAAVMVHIVLAFVVSTQV